MTVQEEDVSGCFCFAPWRKVYTREEGYEPDTAAGGRVSPMTHGLAGQWLVAECTPTEEEAPLPESFEPVPARLGRLLQSAKRYYPALALARESLEADSDHLPCDKEQYAERLADEMERHLKAQRDTPYFMAQAVKPCLTGYRFAGEYVWVVAYDPRLKHVFWVTDDYFVYDSPLAHFVIDEERLRPLPVRELPPWWHKD